MSRVKDMSKSIDLKNLARMGRKKPPVLADIPALEGQAILLSVGNTHELVKTKQHKEEWHTWKVYVHVLDEKTSQASGQSDHIKEVRLEPYLMTASVFVGCSILFAHVEYTTTKTKEFHVCSDRSNFSCTPHLTSAASNEEPLRNFVLSEPDGARLVLRSK